MSTLNSSLSRAKIHYLAPVICYRFVLLHIYGLLVLVSVASDTLLCCLFVAVLATKVLAVIYLSHIKNCYVM